MTVKIALLGFGTVASGVPFLLKENGEKIVQSAHSEIEVAKVLVIMKLEVPLTTPRTRVILSEANEFARVRRIGIPPATAAS